MAINQGSEFLHDEPRFISQKYRDLTFLFGPPSGERYEMLATTARLNAESFSSVYRAYMEEIFTSFEECQFFDQAFSSVLGEDIKINRATALAEWRELAT